MSTLEELRKAGENAQYKSKVLAVFLVPDSEGLSFCAICFQSQIPATSFDGSVLGVNV